MTLKTETEYLKTEYIKCRDALACAVEWIEYVGVEIPSDKLDWLNDRLHKATLLADKIANEDTVEQ